MRSGWTAVATVVLLALAVLLMHLGMPPMSMPTAAASTTHHGAPRGPSAESTTMDRADHGPAVQKQTVDAVHDHESHDCAGTVVVHKIVGAPPLVAVLPLVDRHARATSAELAAVARGPPFWTVFDLAQLCVLRV